MRAKLTNTEIIDILRADRTFLKKEFGVINIGLFGSYARGKQKADSDIDLIVELKEPRFEWLAGLQIYLEMKFGRKIELEFGRKIELVRKGKNVNRRLTQRIERDVIYA